jgi:hypothetical protein
MLGSMSAHHEQSVSEAGGSFSTLAAWYSLIVPFLAPLVVLVALFSSEPQRLDKPLIIILSFEVSSFIAGVVCLYGRGRRILWKPVIGIISSLILGVTAALYLYMIETWHGG